MRFVNNSLQKANRQQLLLCENVTSGSAGTDINRLVTIAVCISWNQTSLHHKLKCYQSFSAIL